MIQQSQSNIPLWNSMVRGAMSMDELGQHIVDLYPKVVVEHTPRGDRMWDILSRLLKDRIVFLGTPVNDVVADLIIAEMLFLESDNRKRDIHFYINSPGGYVHSAFGIYDIMNLIEPDVETVCYGMAASAAAFLLSAGQKGKRKSLANSQIMIHQPLGGYGGQVTDIEIHTAQIVKTKERLNRLLALHAGQSYEAMVAACERDHFLTPEEAKNMGLIDEVVQPKSGKWRLP